MKTNTSLIIKITKFSLILACLCMSQVAQAISVSLGEISFTTVTASIEQGQLEASETIDDTIGGLNGWAIGNGLDSSQEITWNWEPIAAPTLSQDESVDYYTYTINLHMGFNRLHTLRSYSLSIKDPDTNLFSSINNYQSVSNTEENTISVDANGLITTTEPETTAGLDIHTLVFRSKIFTESIILTTTANEAGWGGGNFVLSEITGSVSAEVVPEPSTYALLLGLISFVVIAYKKRIKA